MPAGVPVQRVLVRLSSEWVMSEELGISVDTVCYIILKAREFDAKADVAEDEPESSPADMSTDMGADMGETLAFQADDPIYEELREAIEDLNVDEQIALVALVWVGRGTYTIQEWQDALAEARDARNKRTAQYLLGLPLLADYLENGLAEFGLSCEGFEADHFT